MLDNTLAFFGLTDPPFTRPPAEPYLDPPRRRALEQLEGLVRRRGFATLVGPPGSGKTGRAPFIVVRDGRLHIGSDSFDQLDVRIHEIRPVRKLFEARRLLCFSLDCRTGSREQFCEMCPDRRACSRRLQLRLLYCHDHQEDPAILELSRHSFRPFDELLRQIGDLQRLSEILVTIRTVRTASGWTNLEFQKIF